MPLTVRIVLVNIAARRLNVIPLEKIKERPEHKKKIKNKTKQKKRRR
jgi:hypothetical protein